MMRTISLPERNTSSAVNVPKKADKEVSKATSVGGVLFVAALLLAAVTVPDINAHEFELRQTITRGINAAKAESTQEWISKVGAQAVHVMLRSSSKISYIELLGMKFNKYGVFSVVTMHGEIISIGAFNQVYVL